MDRITYTVLITCDVSSAAHMALVPEMPGGISQGETREEALQNV